ncbi:MAG: tetratricopeptide repeat protein [Bacteroidales bacterium]|nr:tetratricopeptide repeat protein [Bacteroidales bacterium]
MKLRILAVSVSVLLMQAIGLYDSGMYERARGIFETVAQQQASPVSEGYIILCDLQTGAEDCGSRIVAYEEKYGRTALSARIHYLYGMKLFDAGEYAAAKDELQSVGRRGVSRRDAVEALFKSAYSDFALGRDADAKAGFLAVERLPQSDFTAAARYAIGYINYTENNFHEAFGWLERAARDSRFAENAAYYMLECRFMEKDYAYVTANGEAVYATVPAERRAHLARIISESYLVLGDPGKAKEYFDRDALQNTAMSRADLFYAGSLQYALGDYQDAISNFTMMPMRNDSIGQIANYELGNAYIKTKNKVSALGAFRDAAAVDYDPAIREDAWFNYAKLAFDLNHDASVFSSYLDRYASGEKNDQIYGYMALTALYNHDYAGAVEAYDNIDELDAGMKANYMKANYLRANQLISAGSWRDAIPYLRAATFFTDRQDNFNKLARYWLGEAYYQTESYPEAVATFTDLYNQSALDNMAEGRTLPYTLGYTCYQAGDYAGAAKWFDAYLASGDRDRRLDAALRRADCDFVRKDYKAAVDSYRKAADEFSDPNNVYPYYQMGLAYGLLGNASAKIDALSHVKRATLDAPFYEEAMYELGRSYVEARRPGDAYTVFQTLKASATDDTFVARSLIELGMISRNRSDYDEALGFYKQVLERFPQSPFAEDALLAVEAIYQGKGEPDKYIAYLGSLKNPVTKTDTEKEAIYFNSAEQLFLAGNYEKALTALDSYVASYPAGEKIAQAYYYEAECYKQLGKKEKACDYYARVVELAREGSYAELAMLNFANLSYALEHWKDAYGAYSSLLDAAQIESNRFTAQVGMMRSAYRALSYGSAIKCAETVAADGNADEALKREADYIRAMSYLATSQREAAFTLFRTLSAAPATPEGAEASYRIIQDTYDQGNFDDVEGLVYKFAESAGNQSYWLAKAFIVLGDSFMEKDNVRQARATFESVLNGYEPQRGTADDVLDNVKMRLNKLREYEQ